MIIDFHTVWIHMPSIPWLDDFVLLIMTLTIMVSSITKGRYVLKKITECFGSILIMTAYLILFYLINSFNSYGSIRMLLQLIVISIYCYFVEESLDDTLKRFSNVVSLIATISLFFWVLGSLFSIIRPTGNFLLLWTGHPEYINSYFGVYFEAQRLVSSANFMGMTIIRNTAIFSEAPMASFIFSLGFLFEFFDSKRFFSKKSVVLILAIISTFSTSGYTVVVFAFILKYLFLNINNKTEFQFKLMVFPLVLIVSLIIVNYFISQKLDTSSGITRLDDFYAGFMAWKDNLIFGNGFGNEYAYQKYMSAFRRDNLGFSNSPMLILSYGGIYLFAFYLFSAIIGIYNALKNKDTKYICLFSIFLYMFTITCVPFLSLTYYIFFSMVCKNLNLIPLKGSSYT